MWRLGWVNASLIIQECPSYLERKEDPCDSRGECFMDDEQAAAEMLRAVTMKFRAKGV
jgi:hypothetical protein